MVCKPDVHFPPERFANLINIYNSSIINLLCLTVDDQSCNRRQDMHLKAFPEQSYYFIAAHLMISLESSTFGQIMSCLVGTEHERLDLMVVTALEFDGSNKIYFLTSVLKTQWNKKMNKPYNQQKYQTYC